MPRAAGKAGAAVTDVCAACGKSLTPDEVAVTKKLVNRGAKQFLCINCLAAYFEVTPQDILERSAYFKQMGCTLFDPRS